MNKDFNNKIDKQRLHKYVMFDKLKMSKGFYLWTFHNQKTKNISAHHNTDRTHKTSLIKQQTKTLILN